VAGLGEFFTGSGLRQFASAKRDDTLRGPVTIWAVRYGDDLYVRSVNGRTGTWFRGAQDCHEARIQAGGAGKDVLLVERGERPGASIQIEGKGDGLVQAKIPAPLP
jgi:hypothetical protein